MDTGAGNRIRRIDYNFKDHGFVGHMSLPKQFNGHGVIVIMGGEKRCHMEGSEHSFCKPGLCSRENESILF